MKALSYLFVIFRVFCFSQATEIETRCKWDVHNCCHEEIICDPEEVIYLDAKEGDVEERNHCFAISDNDKGEFENFEIEAELLSLESIEGMNTGAVGLMFNFQDPMNYDFIHLQ